MILESELVAIIAKQRLLEERKDDGLPRQLAFNDALLDSHVLDVTGDRRCGKSTVMRQRMHATASPSSLASSMSSPSRRGQTGNSRSQSFRVRANTYSTESPTGERAA